MPKKWASSKIPMRWYTSTFSLSAMSLPSISSFDTPFLNHDSEGRSPEATSPGTNQLAKGWGYARTRSRRGTMSGKVLGFSLFSARSLYHKLMIILPKRKRVPLFSKVHLQNVCRLSRLCWVFWISSNLNTRISDRPNRSTDEIRAIFHENNENENSEVLPGELCAS